MADRLRDADRLPGVDLLDPQVAVVARRPHDGGLALEMQDAVDRLDRRRVAVDLEEHCPEIRLSVSRSVPLVRAMNGAEVESQLQWIHRSPPVPPVVLRSAASSRALPVLMGKAPGIARRVPVSPDPWPSQEPAR